jgi:hypothetical protein
LQLGFDARLVSSFTDVLPGAVAGQDRFGNSDNVLWSKAQFMHHDFTWRWAPKPHGLDDFEQ